MHTPLFIQRIKKSIRERTVLNFCKHCGDVVRASSISRAKTSIYIQPPSLLLLYVSSHPDGSTTAQSKSFWISNPKIENGLIGISKWGSKNCKLLGMDAFNSPNDNVMDSVIDNYKSNLRKNMRFAGSTCLRTLTSHTH